MKIKRVKVIVSIVVVVAFMSVLFTGCGILDSTKNSLKGKLKGVSYSIESYDNYGKLTQTITGQNIDIEGNKVPETGFSSSGEVITNYELSSVLTITIDGKQMSSCGDTLIFAESGLKKEVDFSVTDINSEAQNGITDTTLVSKVLNKYKNYFGKPVVVVIKSQLGVPICAYSGDSIYWEIPSDLPKTTKIMVDGKAIYIHRANFSIIDKGLLN